MRHRQQELERCCCCDEPTGRAGRGDDSLYTDEGEGPYCPECWELLALEEKEGET